MNSLAAASIIMPMASFLLARLVIALVKMFLKSRADADGEASAVPVPPTFAELESRDFFRPIDDMAQIIKGLSVSQKAEIAKKVEARMGLLP